jgi:transposase
VDRLARPRGARVPAIAQTLGLCEATVRLWLTRFNAHGPDGLGDAPRAGRPPTYTPEEVGEVIAASLTNPADLGSPFGSWTLDRLTAYLHEAKGLSISRSRIGELLQAEGLRWRAQETWFGERRVRATQEIDYGRRGKGYVFGAFRPATGEAFTAPYPGRTIAN